MIFIKENYNMKILVYCGLYHAHSFKRMIDQGDYDVCYGFEANIHLLPVINQVIGNDSKIKIFNLAVSDQDGYSSFKISSNGGQSSSLTDFNPEFVGTGDLHMQTTLSVRKVNLLNFLKQQGVDHITDYVSDIQGHDYSALSSLKEWIDFKKIKTIQCEVCKPNKNIYVGVNNTIDNFTNLLGKNYKLVSTGWGQLVDGQYNQVPDEWWEYDAKWQAVE
jgi:FkbM family methyltransferase